MWRLAEFLNNDQEIIDLNIHMRQIVCESGESTLGCVLTDYECEIEICPSYYGMQLSGQALSHIQLMRAIAAAVSFEVVSQNRARR
jgi:hypothetical protein